MPPEFITIILGSLFIIFLGIVFIVYALEFNKRQHKFIKEKDLMNAQFQQALLSSQLEIQEQTFKTISQEIHDNIGQMLTLAKLHLNSIDHNSASQTKEKVDGALDTLSKAIQDLRDISRTLNSDSIGKLGIAKAIEMELLVIGKAANISTTFTCDQTLENIDPQVELILFRIIQEGLHNIIKHAKATLIDVSVLCKSENLILRLKDNGVGFDTHLKGTDGSGLNNMKNRCKLIHAKINLHSGINKGTEISVRLPLANY